jgi:hypothetical protein
VQPTAGREEIIEGDHLIYSCFDPLAGARRH